MKDYLITSLSLKRRINNKFAFASYTGQQRDFKTSGPSTFVLHGETKRAINTAVPENKDNLFFGQLYFYGPDVAEDIINKNVNAFNEISVITNKNDRVHNLPEVTEIAALFKSEDGEVPNYNVLLCNKTGKLKTLSYFSFLKDSATYLLFFPTEAFGWEEKKTYKKGSEQRSLTKLIYYQNLIGVRPLFNPLHHGRLLFQQFLNKELKQKINKQIEDLLEDYLIDDEDNEEAAKKSKRIKLSNSYIGLKKIMHLGCQDGMIIVRKFGKPDFFIQ
uniref:Helitron_like_N domain-containing protein n=1 Tax=Strongyloides venezuelensis TaxID=75913 RepID=A0A0K0FGK7_STRVS